MLKSNLESILNAIPDGADKAYALSVINNFPDIPLAQIDQNLKNKIYLDCRNICNYLSRWACEILVSSNVEKAQQIAKVALDLDKMSFSILSESSFY